MYDGINDALNHKIDPNTDRISNKNQWPSTGAAAQRKEQRQLNFCMRDKICSVVQ